MKRKKAMKKSGLRKRRTGKSAHSYGKLETRRCLASVGLDGAGQGGAELTCDIGDAPSMVEQAAFANTIEGRPETTLRDRVVERLSDRDSSATLGSGAIREIAQRIAETRSQRPLLWFATHDQMARCADSLMSVAGRTYLRPREVTGRLGHLPDSKNIRSTALIQKRLSHEFCHCLTNVRIKTWPCCHDRN